MKDRAQALNPNLFDISGDNNWNFSYLAGSFSDQSSFKTPYSKASLLEQVTDLTPNLVAVYNIQTSQYIFINKSLKPLLGYEVDEWLDKGVKFVITKIHPDDRPRFLKENQKALDADRKIKPRGKDNPIIEFEYRIKHADGTYRWLKTYGAVFDRDQSGNVKHVINISLDITSIKETEEKLLRLTGTLEKKIQQRTKKLKESEQTYHSIFATLTEGLILQDTKGKVLIANHSAAKILNLTLEELKQRPLKKTQPGRFIHEDGSPIFQTQLPYMLALKTGQPQKHQVMGISGSGRVSWILVNSIPLLNGSGKPYAVASSFEDITEQKQLERQKDEFISIASHELKTPLTTIKSFTEILKMQFGQNEKAMHYLDKMDGEIDRLTGLVNELLDVSKIQSGRLQLTKNRVGIPKFISEVIEDIQPTTPHHKIIPKNIAQIKISMDKYRIYQVLINLISNAIKYSPKADKVYVSTKIDNGKIFFIVRDFGIGITERDKKKIFDPFFQAATTIRQSHSGLGLGLHISKEIITRHGGKIYVSSKKGIGSVFKFSLPISVKK